MNNKRIKRICQHQWEVLWQDLDGFPHREVFYTKQEANAFQGYDQPIEPVNYAVGLDIITTYQEW